MSHRKFEHPRQGSLAYMPKRRTKHSKGTIRSFPKDNKDAPIHLTAFAGYKAGMTHVSRYFEKREGKKTIKKDVVEPVTVVECPPMKIVGVKGYIETPRGLRALTTVWAQKLPDGVLRRFYKAFYQSKKKAFTKYAQRYKLDSKDKKHVSRDLQRIKKYCTVVRVIAATQIEKCKLRQKKCHLLEIQVNGGKDASAKVDWAFSKFESEVTLSEVFEKDEMVDTIAITRGHGTTGVVRRFGVSRLPRKSHRGLRKVGCIGAWHPSAVKWTTARAGNLGYYHRTQLNQKIYHLGQGAVRGALNNASTEADPDNKNITPVGGFPHYGIVNEDFVLLRGGVAGPRKRQVTIRKSLLQPYKSFHNLKMEVKFIDTSSKIGHGKFQTIAEKNKFMGFAAKN
jgi:large subunit ribosomal protein L3e